jgi:glycosyltransferase involved in cell wall biosynthesis
MGTPRQETLVIAHNTAKYLLMHYKQLLQDLTAQYDNVICVTPVDGFEQGFAELGIEHRPITMQQHGMNPFVEWRLVAQFYKLYKELRPHQVLNFSIKPCLYGGLAARLAKVPKAGYMVTGLGYVFLTQSFKVSVIRKIVVGLYASILRKKDAVFFQNKDDAALFAQLGITKRAQKFVLPGTGIDVNEFCSTQAFPDIKDAYPLRFLFIGRMLKDKGLYELVAACKKLVEKGLPFECELLGPIDGNPSAIQLNEIQQWQDQGLIVYSGETKNVLPYIEASHVFVLPSYREGLPRACLEAMSLGRAVIATDVPGCREVVKDTENGYLVKVMDIESLADAMEKFIVNPSLISQLGERSRQICEESFAVEKVSDIVLSAMSN